MLALVTDVMSEDNDNPIDWKALWAELDWSDPVRQQEAMKERLRQRAVQYAAPTRDQAMTPSTQTLLAFELGDEVYGVDVMLVRSVRTIDDVMPVPGTPRFYRGVMNIRGNITTVIDLRLFFDISVDKGDLPGELIVVKSDILEIGILAHHVRGVMDVSTETVDTLDDMRYANGLVQGRVIWLDIAHLFTDERLIVGGIDE